MTDSVTVREDERFAIETFAVHLESCGAADGLSWSPGSDPPDFDLDVGGQSYVVEVTRITDEIELGDRVFPDPAIGAALRDFMEDLRSEASGRGLISGAYVLTLVGVPDLKTHRPGALKRAVKYMDRTARVERAEEETVLEVGRARWTIRKQHSATQYVESVYMTSPDGTSGSEIRANLGRWIRERLVEKAEKLDGVHLPTILILVDDYRLGSESDWTERFPMEAAAPFHTVARAVGDGHCQILYTGKHEWSNPPPAAR